MKSGWLVVREERHVDTKYWHCVERDDALTLANDVSIYWTDKYELDEEELDRECYDKTHIFNCSAEDSFRVSVVPVVTRESGETAPLQANA